MGYLLSGVGTVLGLALLLVVYRVLKAAHSKPHTGAGHSSHARGPVERIVLGAVTRFLRMSLRLGIAFGPMMLLTLPGRKSGLPRTNPVDLWRGGDRSFLIATHTGTAAWVRNLRSAGEGVLWLGRKRWAFTASELPRAEAATVIKDVLGPRMRRPVAGFILRQTVPMSPDAPLEDYLDAVKDHPVFEVELTRMPTRGDHVSTLSTTRRAMIVIIAAGLLVALLHATLGITGVLNARQWISGVVIGLLVAGITNHIRIFGRR
jgi:deazaflavin-dependent oxidoreductase (nitroreductase family)